MCKCVECVCVYLLCSCNETKTFVRHSIIFKVLEATARLLLLTVAYFARMHSGTPANTATVFGYR